MQDDQYNDLHIGALILLDGGHSTFLKGQNPSEVASELEAARRNDYDFCWFQPSDREDNSVAVDPNKVVAVIRPQRRPKGAL